MFMLGDDIAPRVADDGGGVGGTIGGAGGGGLGGGVPIVGVPIAPGAEPPGVAPVIGAAIGGGAAPPLVARFFIARKDSWHPGAHQNGRRPAGRLRSS